MKFHNWLQLILTFVGVLVLLGGLIVSYSNIMSELAVHGSEIAGVKTDIARVDKHVASIDEYLRPTRHASIQLPAYVSDRCNLSDP